MPYSWADGASKAPQRNHARWAGSRLFKWAEVPHLPLHRRPQLLQLVPHQNTPKNPNPNAMKKLILILLPTAIFIAACAEQEPPPPPQHVHHHTKAKPENPEFQAVEKPSSYSQ